MQNRNINLTAIGDYHCIHAEALSMPIMELGNPVPIRLDRQLDTDTFNHSWDTTVLIPMEERYMST